MNRPRRSAAPRPRAKAKLSLRPQSRDRAARGDSDRLELALTAEIVAEAIDLMQRRLADGSAKYF